MLKTRHEALMMPAQIGQHLIELPRVNSTNEYLKNLTHPPLPEGTVVMAGEQYAGKGQQNNSWQAQGGKNLTISVLLYPHFLPISRQYSLNKALILAATDSVNALLTDAKAHIKWPNDLYVNNAKLGGLLIENRIAGSTYTQAIVGIGININQQSFDLDRKVTSLSLLTGQSYDLKTFLQSLCEQIGKRYLQLQQASFSKIDQAYLEQLLDLDGKARRFKTEKQEFVGQVVGVSDLGELQILINQDVLEFAHGTICYLD